MSSLESVNIPGAGGHGNLSIADIAKDRIMLVGCNEETIGGAPPQRLIHKGGGD